MIEGDCNEPNAQDVQIGIKLRLLREQYSSSILSLVEVLGIQQDEYEAMEAGRKRISAAQLFLLSAQYGVPLVSFFDGFRHTDIVEIEADGVGAELRS